MSRSSELFTNTPLANLIIIGSCSSAFVYQIIGDPNLVDFTLCPRNVIYLHEFYRIVTSALFHGSIMHLGMNMMSTYAIGNALERRFGTFSFFFTVLWGILLTSFVYMSIAFLLYWACGVDGPFLQHSVGFSGVIFQLSVLESDSSPETHRSVFGFAQVPINIYPWALLVAAQFIMPNISFLGHLSGIIVGTLQTFGLLTFLLPNPIFIREMEEKWTSLHFITSHASYIPLPTEEALDSLQSRSNNPYTFVSIVFTFIMNVLETLKVIAFGRDRHSSSISNEDEEEDETEWLHPNTTNAGIASSRLNENTMEQFDHRMV